MLQAVGVAEVIVLHGLFSKQVESLRNISIDNHGTFGRMRATGFTGLAEGSIRSHLGRKRWAVSGNTDGMQRIANHRLTR
ncbi:hypothetical protein [Halomonas alimentaria]|uniref:hypothetical protein n=1 Tax=Halomonas alimentaria TaxID=147248 RepID=UPI0024900B79|nr:hypothetical protein [Halomonas alimentaria]